MNGLADRRSSGRRSRLPEVLAWVIGALLSVGAFWLVEALEQARTRRMFVEAAAPQARFVRGRILEKIGALRSVRGLFDASVSVERREFATFTAVALARHPGLDFFAWAPRVDPAAVTAWQERMAREGVDEARLRSVGVPPPGADRFPVTYLVAASPPGPLLGLDLAADPVCWSAMTEAVASAEPVSTPPVNLILSGARVAGPLVFLAVYEGGVPRDAAERPAALRGFVIAALAVEALVESVEAEHAVPNLGLTVFDDDAPPDRRVLARAPAPLREGGADPGALLVTARRAGLEWTASVAVGGRPWTIACYASGPMAAPQPWATWGALAAGLLVTALLGAYVSSAGRARAGAALVAQHNQELGRLNRLLTDDVERRRALEQHLRDSEARYRQIIETAAEGIWVIDENAITTFANERMAEMLGYAVPEMTGRSLFDFMDEGGRADALEKLERRPRGVREQHDFQFRSKDGDAVWALVSTNPLVEADGTYRGTLGMLTDITDRKRREAELFESRQMLRLVLDNIPQRVFWKDRNSAYLGCNRIFAQDTGLDDPHAIVGKSDFELSWREFAPLYRADDAQVMATDSPKVSFEEPLVVHGGGRRWLRTSKVPLHAADGTIIGMLGMFEDITEQKEAEQALRAASDALDLKAAELARSNRDLEQFAYIASHDLQEPLRSVAAYLDLLARRYGDRFDEDGTEFLAFATDGARRMQRMIRDLLAYSRVGTRGREFEPTAADAALDTALVTLQLAVEDAGAVITRDPLPTVEADPAQLTGLFQNLLANAVKFHRPDVAPLVHVRAQATDGAWQFAVTDNGIGIPQDQRDRIFGLFQRLHPAREHAGSGIGLAICKRIVERHGGRIWVESAPGTGSTFFFTLPRLDA